METMPAQPERERQGRRIDRGVQDCLVRLRVRFRVVVGSEVQCVTDSRIFMAILFS